MKKNESKEVKSTDIHVTLVQLLEDVVKKPDQDKGVAIARFRKALFSLPSPYRYLMLQTTFQAIPETQLKLANKKALSKFLVGGVADHLDLAFSQKLPLILKNRYSGKITQAQYQALTSIPNLINVSELILLTCGLIRGSFNKMPHSLAETLVEVGNAYLLADYDYCWSELVEVIALDEFELEQEYGLLIELAAISKKNRRLSKDLKNLNTIYLTGIDPNHAHERRFFEVRLANLFFSRSDKNFSLSIRKIAMRMCELDISDNQDIETFLGLMDSAEFSPMINFHKQLQMRDTFRNLFGYSRIKKIKKLNGADIAPVASGNSGILKSFSPMFHDEVASLPRNYAKTDITTFATEETKRLSRDAFVSGFSGHAHDLTSFLLFYASAFSNDPQISEDVNQAIQGLIAFYIKKGFHSFWEMRYVFEHPLIHSLFAQCNVTLSIKFRGSILLAALLDTQEYTLRLCSKRLLHLQLTSQQGIFQLKKTKKSEEKNDHKRHQPKNSNKSYSLEKFMHKLLLWGGDEVLMRKILDESVEDNIETKAIVTQSRDDLKRSALSWGFECKDVMADGNCFFRAVIDQMLKNGIPHNKHQVLREVLAQVIGQYTDQYQEFFDKVEDHDTYIDTLNKLDAWVDGVLVGKAFAQLKAVIVVIIANNGSEPIVFKPKGATQKIVLGFETRGHYQSLISLEEKSTPVKLQTLIDQTKEIPTIAMLKETTYRSELLSHTVFLSSSTSGSSVNDTAKGYHTS